MKPFASAGLVLLFTACSTGRIDVDIYKGPLTNEQDVQMHQLAAFAVGVKPVLVHIRDQMEATSRHIHMWDWRNRPGYRPGPMKSVAPLGGRAFVSREAEYVNSVLELYLDADEIPRGGPLDSLRAGLERYRQAYRIVNALDEEGFADRRAWEACADARPSLDAEAKGGVAAAVKKFLVIEPGKRRDALGLVRALQSASDTNAGIREMLLLHRPHSETGAIPLPSDRDSRGALGSFSSYRILTERALWDRIATALFEDDGPATASARYAVAERGSLVANAFFAACAEIRAAFTDCLELVIARDDGTREGDRICRSLLITAAHLVTRRRLIETLESANQSLQVQDALAILRTPAANNEDAVARSVDRIRERVGSNRKMATEWLRLFHQSSEPGPAAESRPAWSRISAEWAAFQGFLAGPEREVQELGEASPLLALASLIDDGIGFATGRLFQGLDTLITRFFTEFHKSEKTAFTQRRQLMAALVQFAEKLRPVPVLAQLANVQVDARFVTLTESIANSISTQVDALERSYDWMGDPDGTQEGKRQKRVATTELEGWKGALGSSRPASSVLHSQPTDSESKGATDVIDALIARLEYLRIDTVAQGGADTKAAKDLQAALDLAHAHRTGMVKLLPAATYLRNSYPSSSLQGMPLFYETSILGDRGTPILDYGKKELAVVMDKQYWQTVNTIAVTGVGDTNSVLVKDDLGNWTIKSYSGDPKDIVAAMKQLALYATGAGISPAALVQADQLKAVLAKSHSGTALEQADKDLLATSKTSGGGQGKAILAAQWKQANTRAKAALESRRAELVKALGAAIATWDPKPALTATELTERIEKAVPALALDGMAVDGGLASWLALRKTEDAFLAECRKTSATLAAALQKPAGTSSQPSTEDTEKKLAAVVASWLAETRKARLALVRETRRALEVVDEASAAQR